MLLENLSKVNESNKRSQLLLEKEMLDISILNADKLKNHDEFLNNTYTVTEKFDGTKLTVWRNDEDWNTDYTKNWVVSFKNQILYSEEFHSTDREKTKKHSVGISQYAFVHDHLKSIHNKTKSFPKNTEIFIEFIQNKLTTTRDYENKHGLYIIASSPATGEITGGMLKTKPSGFFQDKVEELSTILELNIPPVVFEGSFNSVSSFENGIKNTKLMNSFKEYKDEFDSNPYETVKKIFLDFESTLGGKTEGVVLQTESGRMYKFVQDDQYDKDLRFSKKLKYQASPEIETQYWETIKEVVNDTLIGLDYSFDKLSYQDILKTFSNTINNMDENEIEKRFKFKFDAMLNDGKMK